MLIFGDKLMEHLPFYEIISKEDIKKSPSNSVVLFDFDKEIAKYCAKNGVLFAIRAKNIKELVYANALECSYAFVDKEFAKIAQKIADEYLFDTKIILPIKSDEELEWAALNGIDGVIYIGGINGED